MAQEMLDQANFSMIQSQSRMEQEQKDMETLLSIFTENIVGDQQDQNVSQGNNVVPKTKMKQRKHYSNTKVKARNLLTNVSYRRFKQSDLNKTSFIVDMLSFLVQNFNPINLERKLDVYKEHDMIKYLWEDCTPHDFVRYMYKQENYAVISKPNLTYQKANNIVKNFILEEMSRINTLKYKVEEKFPLIYYIYLLLFSKIYNRTNNFGIQNKNNFDFYFQTWKNRKTAGTLGPKLLKQLPLPQANQVTCEVLSTVNDPNNYKDRGTQKNQQVLIDAQMSDNELSQPTMVSVNTAADEFFSKKQAEKREILEKQLSENTVKMNKLKKTNKL